MKKPSFREKLRVKLLNERSRLGRKISSGRRNRALILQNLIIQAERWLENNLSEGVDYDFLDSERRHISLVLPPSLNFSTNYNGTVQIISAIRYLTDIGKNPGNRKMRGYLHLARVSFDNVRSLSTSAGLVLASEIARWNDSLNGPLQPRTENWDPLIRNQLSDLGFFELFGIRHKPCDATSSTIRSIKYLRGSNKGAEKAIVLKEKIQQIIKNDIDKWTYLYSGLSEAVTNVCEHAYPSKKHRKYWYLTGGYHIETKELKIAFFDQGIGIPNSLPYSDMWEKAKGFLADSNLYNDHPSLIKAAVEMGRSRTGKQNKGRGLQDLHEFIRERDSGYLSILSLSGLYKFEKNGSETRVKTEKLDYPLLGTLIIWSIILEK